MSSNKRKIILPFLIFLMAIFFSRCKDDGYDNPNRPLKKHVFEAEGVEMGFPERWELENNNIYIENGRKIAEIVTGVVDISETSITTDEFIERLRNNGPVIEGKDHSYAFPKNYVVLDVDSIKVNGSLWYIAQTEANFDGPKEYGSVFNNYFVCIEEGKMKFVNLYTFSYFPLDRQFSKDILKTFQVK